MKIKSRTFANFLLVISFVYVFVVSFIYKNMLNKFSNDSVWVDRDPNIFVILPIIVAVIIALFYNIRKEYTLRKIQVISLFLIVSICIAFPYSFTPVRYEASANGITEYYITNQIIAFHDISEAKEVNIYFGSSKDGSYFLNYELVFKDGYTHLSQTVEDESWWSVFEEIDKTLRTNNTPRYVYRPYLYDDILEYGYDDSGVFEHQQIVENMLDGALTVPS